MDLKSEEAVITYVGAVIEKGTVYTPSTTALIAYYAKDRRMETVSAMTAAGEQDCAQLVPQRLLL